MNALDTSVCIPALLSWHEHHEPSRAASTYELLDVEYELLES